MPATETKIISWNVKNTSAARQVIDHLSLVQAQNNADIILLQEVTHSVLDSLKEQLSLSDSGFSGFDLYYDFHPRNNKMEDLCTISRYKFSSNQSVALAGGNRISLLSSLAVPSIGTLKVANIHLSPVKSMVLYNKYRQECRSLVAENSLFLSVNVLGGDFNSTKMSKIIRALGRHFNLATKEVGNTWYLSKLPVACFDYAFVDKSFSVKEAKTLSKGPSDHKPVFINLAKNGQL